MPLATDWVFVVFGDAGDVSRQEGETFRFYLPQVALGFGLRYKTLVGPLRLDVGFRPAGLQAIGDDPRLRRAARSRVQPSAVPFPALIWAWCDFQVPFTSLSGSHSESRGQNKSGRWTLGCCHSGCSGVGCCSSFLDLRL